MLNKKTMIIFLISMLFATMVPVPSASAATQATYYVSPSGSDSNPGTLEQPFATIAKARDVVRTINSNMTGDIYVYLRGGTYTLNSTLELNGSDSGTNGYQIIYKNYQNEQPIISGGTAITGWTLYDASKSIYKATAPASFDTRQLYVNGNRAVRARGETNPAGWSAYPSLMYSSGSYTSNTNAVSVTVDLGATQSVGAVSLYPRTGIDAVGGGSPNFPVDFTIQVSTDGTNYTTVKTVTAQANPDGDPVVYSFTATNARYVKLNVTKLGTPATDETTSYRLQLAEMQILSSENLVLNKTVTSSSSDETSVFGVAKLTDGIAQSKIASIGYSSNGFSSAENTVNVTVDLGASKSISIVKLYPRTCQVETDPLCHALSGENANFPVDFTIQLSTDGTNYTTVKTITNQSNPFNAPQEYTFSATNARYIKINVTKLGLTASTEPGTYRLQLAELEAFTSGNLALNKAVTSSDSVESSGIGVAKLTDGRNKSYSSIGHTAPDSSMASWKNISDIEEVSIPLYYWWMNRVGIDSISGTTVLLDHNWTDTWVTDGPEWIENAYELIDKEGEWYLDKTGAVDGTTTPKFYYKPRYGENMLTSEIIAPKVETLILGKGTLDNPIHHIQFYGIAFEYSNWVDPNSRGYIDAQGGFKNNGPFPGLPNWIKVNSAVSFFAAKSITFERNLFTHLGAAALNFEYGSQDNTIIGNRFEDISAGGIYIGDIRDHHPSDTRAINKNNTIKNNYLTLLGLEYFDTVAIWAGYTENTVIDHNEIYNHPSVAVSLGWGWGDFDAGGAQGLLTPTVAKNNKIRYNLIRYSSQKMWDTGHIYTLGNQGSSSEYSIISHNYLDYANAPYGEIYLDSGSRYLNVNNNVIRHPYHNWILAQRYNADPERNAKLNLIQNNYSDTSATDINFDNTVSDNTVVTDENWPMAAQTIMNNAGIEPAYQDIKINKHQNMAFGQTATVSSSLEMLGWGVVKLTDGLKSECFTSTAYTSDANTAFATIDLGADRTVGSVKLFPRANGEAVGGGSPGFPVDFTIQVSSDGTNFRTVKTVTGQANPLGKGQEYAFAPTNARYVKINATKLGDPAAGAPTYYLLQLAEVEVYSQSNIAWNKAVTATNSLEITNWSTAFLTDGNTSYISGNAGYTSQAYTSDANTVYAQVDLGSTQNIDAVQLTPRLDGAVAAGGGTPNFPVDFTIQVSTDGTNYTTVKTVTAQANPNGSPQLYKFAPTDARYVKVNATKLGLPVDGSIYYLLQLSEMEVFANGNLARDKTATATNSLEITGWSLNYINDGNTYYVPVNAGYTSHAYTADANTVYAQIDLGSSKSVGSVKLWPRLDGAVSDNDSSTPGFPVDFTIQVSTDGTNYTTVKTVTGQTSPKGTPFIYTFTPTNARYVKVNATKLGERQSGNIYYLLQLSEFEIFN